MLQLKTIYFAFAAKVPIERLDFKPKEVADIFNIWQLQSGLGNYNTARKTIKTRTFERICKLEKNVIISYKQLKKTFSRFLMF